MFHPYHKPDLSYTLNVVTPSTADVVDVLEMQTHLDLNDGDEGVDNLDDYLRTAVITFESETRRMILSPTVFSQSFSCWQKYNPLYVGNITSISSVTYYDENDVLQNLVGFDSDLTGCPGLVYLPGFAYPALSTNKPRPISVEFTAGYTTVPEDIRTAIKLYAAHLYNNRSNSTEKQLDDISMGWKNIVQGYSTGLQGSWNWDTRNQNLNYTGFYRYGFGGGYYGI